MQVPTWRSIETNASGSFLRYLNSKDFGQDLNAEIAEKLKFTGSPFPLNDAGNDKQFDSPVFRPAGGRIVFRYRLEFPVTGCG